jgi:uncharacterized protein (TIGR03086 family)
MDNLDALDLAARGFADTLALVGPDQWDLDSPNDGQTVRQLVDHVIGGNRMAVAILNGGSREDGLAQFARSADDVDLIAAFEEARAEQAAAFAVPGALEIIVNHPAMPMPGAQLLGFRLTEYALHGWDLAMAIGAESTIDPHVAEAVWGVLEPMLPLMAASGMFGEGPSGTLGSDASAHDRIVDASGRRPQV